MITININQAPSQLLELLTFVEKRGEIVIICRNGKPVAEIRQAAIQEPLTRSRIQPDPTLSGKLLYDPTEPASNDEWPEEFR